MQALRIGIAVVVTAIWAGTYGKYLVVGGTAPPAELSGVMMLVVTWALGAELRDAWRAKYGNEDRR